MRSWSYAVCVNRVDEEAVWRACFQKQNKWIIKMSPDISPRRGWRLHFQEFKVLTLEVSVVAFPSDWIDLRECLTVRTYLPGIVTGWCCCCCCWEDLHSWRSVGFCLKLVVLFNFLLIRLRDVIPCLCGTDNLVNLLTLWGRFWLNSSPPAESHRLSAPAASLLELRPHWIFTSVVNHFKISVKRSLWECVLMSY